MRAPTLQAIGTPPGTSGAVLWVRRSAEP